MSALRGLFAPSLVPPIPLVEQAQGGADDLAGTAVTAGADLLGDQRGQFGREADVQGGLGGHRSMSGRMAKVAIRLAIGAIRSTENQALDAVMFI